MMTEHRGVPGAPVPEESTVTAEGHASGGSEQPSAGAAPPPPAAGAAAGSGTEKAWDDVVDALGDLGGAVSTWARTMSDTPENRRRVTELKEGLDGMGRQLGEVIDTTMKSGAGVGQQIGSAAMAAGGMMVDTAKRVGDEVAPYVASAFKSAAEGLRQAAERMEQRAQESEAEAAKTAEAATAPQPSPQQAPYTGEEPPGPAPSGIGSDYTP